MENLSAYDAKSGTLVPVFTIEVQTLPEDTDRILDEVMKVHPLSFGCYQRNASISAIGKEPAQPMVELKISIDRDLAALANVMDAIIYAHHYEEPVIFVREDWASRAAYDPKSENPNRWWNNGKGLPDRLE